MFIFHKAEVQMVILRCLTAMNLIFWKLRFRPIKQLKMTIRTSVLWKMNIHISKKWPEMAIEPDMSSQFYIETVYMFLSLHQPMTINQKWNTVFITFVVVAIIQKETVWPLYFSNCDINGWCIERHNVPNRNWSGFNQSKEFWILTFFMKANLDSGRKLQP